MTQFERTLGRVPQAAPAILLTPERLALALAAVLVGVSTYWTARDLLPAWVLSLAALHLAVLVGALRRGGTPGRVAWAALILQGLATAWLSASLMYGLEWLEAELAIFWTTAAVTLGAAVRHAVWLLRKKDG